MGQQKRGEESKVIKNCRNGWQSVPALKGGTASVGGLVLGRKIKPTPVHASTITDEKVIVKKKIQKGLLGDERRTNSWCVNFDAMVCQF
jgi:hypothetical protein